MFRAINKIVIIGCGGIGSWLLGPLLRFLNAEDFKGEVHIWDGDRYGPENQERQEFEEGAIGQNKAETQAGAFRGNYAALRIISHAEYVTEQNVARAVTEHSIIITAVDNHPLRCLVDRQAGALNEVCVLSAGNEKLDGNVHVLLRRAGKEITAPLLQRHPEIAKSKHGNRAEMGCEAMVAKGETQLLITNFLAAAATMAAFHILWTYGERTGKRRQTIVPQELYFDAGLGSMSLVAAAT
jgi:molybdopterin/thiamine biosynthesis adenylyltransferase